MTLKLPSDRSSGRKQSSVTASPEYDGESSREMRATSPERSESFSQNENPEPRPHVPLAEVLERPQLTQAQPQVPAARASLSRLPEELTVLLVAQLSPDDALRLRHASSNFLRLMADSQILRAQYRQAGLSLPAGLSTSEARDGAWEELARLVALRRQYGIGPTNVRVLAGHDGPVNSPLFLLMAASF